MSSTRSPSLLLMAVTTVFSDSTSIDVIPANIFFKCFCILLISLLKKICTQNYHDLIKITYHLKIKNLLEKLAIKEDNSEISQN